MGQYIIIEYMAPLGKGLASAFSATGLGLGDWDFKSGLRIKVCVVFTGLEGEWLRIVV